MRHWMNIFSFLLKAVTDILFLFPFF
jgi:hypothetical protein